MGNICQDCLKKQNVEPDNKYRDIQMHNTSQHDINESRHSESNFISIESNIKKSLKVDFLVMLADKPEAIMNNQFIKDLSTSHKIVLQERIKQKAKSGKSENYIKIADPFFDIPIKKLVIVEMNVWDGKAEQDIAINKALDKFFVNEVMSTQKASSIAIVEVDVKIFQMCLWRKIKEVKQKLSKVHYLTKNREQAASLIRSTVESASSLSNQSNYY